MNARGCKGEGRLNLRRGYKLNVIGMVWRAIWRSDLPVSLSPFAMWVFGRAYWKLRKFLKVLTAVCGPWHVRVFWVGITSSKPLPYLQWFMFRKCSSTSKHIFVKLSYVLKTIALLLILEMLFSPHYFSVPRVKDSVLLLDTLWLLACSVLGNPLRSRREHGRQGQEVVKEPWTCFKVYTVLLINMASTWTQPEHILGKCYHQMPSWM